MITRYEIQLSDDCWASALILCPLLKRWTRSCYNNIHRYQDNNLARSRFGPLTTWPVHDLAPLTTWSAHVLGPLTTRLRSQLGPLTTWPAHGLARSQLDPLTTWPRSQLGPLTAWPAHSLAPRTAWPAHNLARWPRSRLGPLTTWRVHKIEICKVQSWYVYIDLIFQCSLALACH
jgi:hypothetical protein